jgi:cell division protease FtsH
MRSPVKTLAFWAVLVAIGLLLFQAYHHQHRPMIADFNYSKFRGAIEAGHIASVTFKQDSGEIAGEIKPEFESKYGGRSFNIFGNTEDEGYKLVIANGLTPNYERAENNGLLQSIFINWLPLCSFLSSGKFRWVVARR